MLIILILVGDIVAAAVSIRAPVTPVTCSTIVNGSCETQQLRIAFVNTQSCVIRAGQTGTTNNCNITFASAMTNAPTAINIFNISQIHVYFDQNYFFQSAPTPATWSNMPAALTEIYGNSNLELVMQESNSGTTPYCGLLVNVVTPGVAGAVLRVQFTNDTITWGNLFADTASTDVPISTAGISFGALANTPVRYGASQSVIFLRVVGLNGNGIVSPSFTEIYLQCDWLTQGESPAWAILSVSASGFAVAFGTFLAVPVDTAIHFSYVASLCLKASC